MIARKSTSLTHLQRKFSVSNFSKPPLALTCVYGPCSPPCWGPKMRMCRRKFSEFRYQIQQTSEKSYLSGPRNFLGPYPTIEHRRECLKIENPTDPSILNEISNYTTYPTFTVIRESRPKNEILEKFDQKTWPMEQHGMLFVIQYTPLNKTDIVPGPPGFIKRLVLLSRVSRLVYSIGINPDRHAMVL